MSRSTSYRRSLNVSRVAGYDNMALFIRHGLCLGFTTRKEDYFCYLTYVGHKEFFKSQSDIHQVSKMLLDLHDKMKAIAPYYMVDKEQFRKEEAFPALIQSGKKNIFTDKI